MHKLKVKLDKLGFGEVLLDDKPLHCDSIEISSAVSSVTRATIGILVGDLDVELDGERVEATAPNELTFYSKA